MYPSLYKFISEKMFSETSENGNKTWNGVGNETRIFFTARGGIHKNVIIVRYSRSEYAIKVEHWALQAKFKVEKECGKWKLVKKKSKMRMCLQHFTMCMPINMCMSYEAE